MQLREHTYNLRTKLISHVLPSGLERECTEDGRPLRGADFVPPRLEGMVLGASSEPEGMVLGASSSGDGRPLRGAESKGLGGCNQDVRDEFLRSENLSGSRHDPFGSCTELPPATDDDRQMDIINTTSSKTPHQSKPAIAAAIAEYDKLMCRAMNLLGSSDDEMVEIEVGDESEDQQLGGSLTVNAFDAEEVDEEEEMHSDPWKMREIGLETEFPASVPKGI